MHAAQKLLWPHGFTGMGFTSNSKHMQHLCASTPESTVEEEATRRGAVGAGDAEVGDEDVDAGSEGGVTRRGLAGEEDVEVGKGDVDVRSKEGEVARMFVEGWSNEAVDSVE